MKREYIGTIGPSCADEHTIASMMTAGMTALRLNLSHGGLRSHLDWLEAFGRARDQTGCSCGLIIDTQGPELRCGNERPMKLADGMCVFLGTEIPVPDMLLAVLRPGAELALDDGKMRLRVIDGQQCLVVRGGTLLPHKSLALLNEDVRLPVLTEGDLENLALAKEYGVTAIMQPFVRGAEDISEVRAALKRLGADNLKILAKIEDIVGVKHVGFIASAADVVVIARGDLGNGQPLWRVPILQKRIAETCRKTGTPFWVGTQLLASMEQSTVPTRAEMNDIFNSVLDGAQGFILTGETAVGRDPAGAITYLHHAADAADDYQKGEW